MADWQKPMKQIGGLGAALGSHTDPFINQLMIWSYVEVVQGMTLVICATASAKNLNQLGPGVQYLGNWVVVEVQRIKNKEEAIKFWEQLEKLINMGNHMPNRTIRFGELTLQVSISENNDDIRYVIEVQKIDEPPIVIDILRLKGLMNIINEYFGLDVPQFPNC